jgi:NAD(P)-dependent dehydrogenase (short-subunit alcohol dehydrogenase family)
MADLNGKVAIVTGGAAGIGAGCVRALSEAGASVATCDMQTKGQLVCDAVAADTSGEVRFTKADVRNADDVKAFVDGTVDAFGRLDIVVSNAGVWRPTDPLNDSWETSVEQFDLLHSTNLRGLYLTGRAAIPHLAASGGGNIVNIATDHICPPPGAATGGGTRMDSYDSSKWGINGLTQSWAKRLGDAAIRVNALCMDATDSEMVRYARGRPVTDEEVAVWMTPAEIAGLMLELIGEGPDGRTGENIGIWLNHPTQLPERSIVLPSRHP